MSWLASPEWAGLVKTLLHTLWQGGIIVGFLAIAMRRMENPVARYRSLLAALAGVILLGLVTWAVLNHPVPPVLPSLPERHAQPAATPMTVPIRQRLLGFLLPRMRDPLVRLGPPGWPWSGSRAQR